jgi:hypothetical protein
VGDGVRQQRGFAPARSKDFAHLPLSGLRKYRSALQQEESRVSYWRRILQARLDTLRASDAHPRDMSRLRPVLTETRVSGGRRALIEVMPDGDIPPLPNLESLWERSPIPGDPESHAELANELVKAEAQLSAYRMALHRRLAAATGELIARYREDPRLALTALPLPREKRETRARGA